MTVVDVAAETPAEKRALLQRLLAQQSTFPLSAGQQWLWFLQQLAPDSAAYHFPHAMRITSRIDVEAMRSALQALINRHAAFRTVFTERDSAIVQHVQADAVVSFTVTDVGGMDAAAISSLVARESEYPIDLGTGPVFRSHLFRESDTCSVLLLVWHHIVLDGWSIALVLDELGVMYDAYHAEQPWQLPPAVPYREFVEWQQRMLVSKEGQSHANFWQEQLQHVEPLDIATDFKRPTNRSYRGGSVLFALGESVTTAVHEMATGENVTPFVVLLACFQGFLHRITGHERIPVSYPVNGRTSSRFAKTAGFFVNQLTAVGTIGRETTFRELIAATKAGVLAALEHQDYHLSLLPPMQRAQAPGSQSTSSDAMFVLQKSQAYQLELPRGVVRENALLDDLHDDRHIVSRGKLGALPVESFPLEGKTARFDLEMHMLESGGALLGLLQYDAEIFSEESARMFTACFQRLVSHAVGHLDLRVSAVDILGAVEQRRVLTELNNTERHWPDEGGIADVFERAAGRSVDNLAARCGNRQLTFDELDARANRIAHWLRHAGVRPQEIIGLAVPRSLDMLIAMLGVIKAGCIYLPLDPSNPAERLNFMLNDSGARLVITSGETCTRFRRSPVHQLCMHCDEARIDAEPITRVSRGDTPLLYLLYTSGSTGEPKGVPGTVRGALNRMYWMWETLPFGEGEVCAQLTTPGFVDAVWEILGPLLRGVPIVIIPDEDVRDTERLVHALEKTRATRITLVPSLLRVLLDREDVSARLRHLRFWSCSGEALDRSLAERFHQRLPDARLFNLYGCSEASADSAWFEIRADWRGERVPIGKPIANTQILLLDSYGNLVPPGVVGEIHIGGAGLAPGYLKRPELSTERWVESRLLPGKQLYRTGDLGRRRADGAIEYFGRADQQLKIRGNRVETAEVEHVLRQHPDVAQVAVVGMMEPSGDQALVAYIVPALRSSADGAATSDLLSETTLRTRLRAYLAQSVPTYMVPSHWVQLDSMPLTASGKIDRRVLPVPGSAERSSAYVAPRTETERQLANIWQQTLEVRRLGIHDDFFEWGGHSILAVQTMSRMSKHFKRSLPVAMLFQFPTVATFGLQLDGDLCEHSRHEVIPIDVSGDGPPLFWIPGGAALPSFTRLKELASHIAPERSLHGVGTRLAERMSEVESVPARAFAYVTAIRTVQPRGPYSLAGFCLGGVVAFEVAQQLEAAGEDVAFLALVNTWMPASAISGSHWLLLFLQRAVHHVRFALRSPTVDTRQYLWQRAATLRRLLTRSRQAVSEWSAATGDMAPLDAPSEDAVLRATVHLASSYQPQSYGGTVHVFISEEPELVGVSARLDPRLAWRRVCSKVEVLRLHGGHDAMLDVPLVDEFGVALRSALRAAQRG
ncbi:MAG: amino acid adenylation domain-containing protein [Gemmatimonadaceae bacterium]